MRPGAAAEVDRLRFLVVVFFFFFFVVVVAAAVSLPSSSSRFIVRMSFGMVLAHCLRAESALSKAAISASL